MKVIKRFKRKETERNFNLESSKRVPRTARSLREIVRAEINPINRYVNATPIPPA
jgi:hypothetical protein